MKIDCRECYRGSGEVYGETCPTCGGSGIDPIYQCEHCTQLANNSGLCEDCEFELEQRRLDDEFFYNSL